MDLLGFVVLGTDVLGLVVIAAVLELLVGGSVGITFIVLVLGAFGTSSEQHGPLSLLKM